MKVLMRKSENAIENDDCENDEDENSESGKKKG